MSERRPPPSTPNADRQLVGTMLRGEACAGAGPFAQGRLDEEFGLAVSPRRVGLGEDWSDTKELPGRMEGRGAIA